MTDSNINESLSPPTIEAKEQALENRVSALEQALASLGDTVSPGGSRGVATYTNWRKGIPAK